MFTFKGEQVTQHFHNFFTFNRLKPNSKYYFSHFFWIIEFFKKKNWQNNENQNVLLSKREHEKREYAFYFLFEWVTNSWVIILFDSVSMIPHIMVSIVFLVHVKRIAFSINCRNELYLLLSQILSYWFGSWILY